jgi:hypothetical protein
MRKPDLTKLQGHGILYPALNGRRNRDGWTSSEKTHQSEPRQAAGLPQKGPPLEALTPPALAIPQGPFPDGVRTSPDIRVRAILRLPSSCLGA